MRIKLDSSSYDLPEEVREIARNDFLKVYDQFPVQVFGFISNGYDL
jgi:hypothetical protein